MTVRSYLLSTLKCRFRNGPMDNLLKEHAGCWLVWEPGNVCADSAQFPLENTIDPANAIVVSPSSSEPLALTLQLRAGQRQLTLGRGEQCDFIINESTLSQLHWVFICVEARWTVRDAASKNGSFLNGLPLIPGRPASLRGGDKLTAAKLSFTFLESSGMYQRLQENA